MILLIYSLEHNLNKKDINSIVLSTIKGQTNILEKHINLVTILNLGLLRFKISNKWYIFLLYRGITEVKKDQISIITNKFEKITKIRIADAAKQLKIAILNLRNAKTNRERLKFSWDLRKETILLEAMKYLS
uniref:ATP synthase CF1 epsilon subunit n=1 Tax=Nitzschia sp. PL1-4 TaxID=2083272 RepID=A0A2Z5ZA70_9STRA|nr:ATP synthase CF1 epsilon subunit [Nitzschia sp. PL1-4]